MHEPPTSNLNLTIQTTLSLPSCNGHSPLKIQNLPSTSHDPELVLPHLCTDLDQLPCPQFFYKIYLRCSFPRSRSSKATSKKSLKVWVAIRDNLSHALINFEQGYFLGAWNCGGLLWFHYRVSREEVMGSGRRMWVFGY
jgi:hypothetical protein